MGATPIRLPSTDDGRAVFAVVLVSAVLLVPYSK